MVDTRPFHFLYSSLHQRIAVETYGESKRLAFPAPVDVKVEVFGILIALDGIAATTRIKVICRVLRKIDIMF